MTDLSSIHDPAEILREVNVVLSPENTVSPHQLESVDSPVGDLAAETDDYSLRLDPIVPAVVASQPLPMPAVVVPSVDDRPFSYRLPMFSYLLIWFYGLLAVMLSLLTASAIVGIAEYGGQQSHYSLTSGVNSVSDFGSYGNELGYYQSILLIDVGVLVAVASLIFALVSGKRIFRYLALLVCVVALGFELYSIVSSLSSMSSYVGSSSGWYYFSSFSTIYFPYLTYLLLPLLTLVYLLTPTARKAYK